MFVGVLLNSPLSSASRQPPSALKTTPTESIFSFSPHSCHSCAVNFARAIATLPASQIYSSLSAGHHTISFSYVFSDSLHCLFQIFNLQIISVPIHSAENPTRADSSNSPASLLCIGSSAQSSVSSICLCEDHCHIP